MIMFDNEKYVESGIRYIRGSFGSYTCDRYIGTCLINYINQSIGHIMSTNMEQNNYYNYITTIYSLHFKFIQQLLNFI